MQRHHPQTQKSLNGQQSLADVVYYAVIHGLDFAQAAVAATSRTGAFWCRIADQTLLWANKDDWQIIEPELHARHAHKAKGPLQAARGRLYLAVQKGNELVRSYPWISVVLHKGRYLIVELNENELQTVRPGRCASWGIRPLPQNTVILDVPPRIARAPVAWVSDCVNDVSQTSYNAFLTQLVGYFTRHSLSSSFQNAADWARIQFHSMGYETELRAITTDAGPSWNVVARRRGLASSPRVVIISGHLDSINAVDGPTGPAPGADDNGSGAAGVLEIARVLMNFPAEHDLVLILFGGEEQGLHGSLQYVAGLNAAERARIRAVINMDMIASLNTSEPTVLLEGAPVSQTLIDDLAAAAGNYTSLAVQSSLHPFASDHVPFIDASLPAVLTIEGADRANNNVHTAADTLNTIHLGLGLEIVRMNLATAVTQLGRKIIDRQPVTSSPVAAWGEKRLDVFVIGTDAALYHKWWNGSSWGPSLTGYEKMGGICTQGPRAAAWGPNRLDVFVIGPDTALYHKWWNGAAWGPSLTGYEKMGSSHETSFNITKI